MENLILRGKDGISYTWAHWNVINEYGSVLYDGLFSNEAHLIAKQHGLRPVRNPWFQKKFDEGFFTEEQAQI